MTAQQTDAGAPSLRWEDVLDRLELDVARCERKLADPDAPAPEPWQEPQLAGPLPDDLAARARALLARQRAVSGQLAAAVHGVRRQQEFAARVDRATVRRDQPVYLDVDA